MGCCFSNPGHRRDTSRHPPSDHHRSPPPPPPEEEEAVKEVLSETPLFHATSPPPPEPLTPNKAAAPAADRRSPELRRPPTLEAEPLLIKLEEEEEEETAAPSVTEDGDASEYSELCSVGESLISTATTNTTATVTATSAAAERGEVVDDGEVTSKDCRHVARIKRRVVRRSAGSRPVPQKPVPASKPPLSRSELPRARHERSTPTALGTRTRSELTNQNSRSSAARVGGGARRSPAVRGGNSGGKMVGQSGRVVGGEGNNIAKNLMADEKTEWEKMKTTVDESLDNPLVSLECFIFL